MTTTCRAVIAKFNSRCTEINLFDNSDETLALKKQIGKQSWTINVSYSDRHGKFYVKRINEINNEKSHEFFETLDAAIDYAIANIADDSLFSAHDVTRGAGDIRVAITVWNKKVDLDVAVWTDGLHCWHWVISEWETVNGECTQVTLNEGCATSILEAAESIDQWVRDNASMPQG